MSEKQTIGGIAPKPVLSGKDKTVKEPIIRTMQKDIDSLCGHSSIEAPQNLPVAKEGAGKAEERAEIQKKLVGKAREEKIREQKIKVRAWVKANLSVILKSFLVGIVVVFVAGIIGGFFYWWNYMRTVIPPVVITHYQCQNFQCISIEGEGDDQCQTEQDCQPAEPEIPQSLIPVDGTETIEIELRHEDMFIWELGLILAREQEENILNNILVKISNRAEREYISLSDFISISGLDLPENIIQSAVEDDLGGMNYSFFSYNQIEGKRLGLIIKIAEGVDLSADLKEWEVSVLECVDEFFIYLKDRILLANTEEFQDNVYNNIAIRYLNFPNPDLSIDYAIVGNKLIIATSRESMYAVIDALLPNSLVE